MTKVKVFDMTGAEVSEIELDENIFGLKEELTDEEIEKLVEEGNFDSEERINRHAVYLVVKNQLANKRQGTHACKTRAEVRGGGRKPWRQKGTGRARQGSIRSPQWRKGGIVFAKKPRDYSYTTPKKVRRLALKSVLTSKANENEIIVIDDIKIDNIKTKDFKNFLNAVGVKKSAYVVTAEHDKNVNLSARNIAGVTASEARLINVYDLLRHDNLVISKAALGTVSEVFK